MLLNRFKIGWNSKTRSFLFFNISITLILLLNTAEINKYKFRIFCVQNFYQNNGYIFRRQQNSPLR